jgi:hypothetical protein
VLLVVSYAGFTGESTLLESMYQRGLGGRRSLRPATYARLHENRWVSAESTFLTPELWDARAWTANITRSCPRRIRPCSSGSMGASVTIAPRS